VKGPVIQRDRKLACVVQAGLTLAGCLAGDSARAAACTGQPVTSGVIAQVIDSRSFLLTDGRKIVLAGIEVPAGQGGTALDLVGHAVTLTRSGPDDRYGRVPAFVFAAGSSVPVQHGLLAQGQARVAARAGDRACAADLLAAEKAARRASLGLWADPGYVIRRAESGGDLLAERGRFAIAEGKVLSVRESGGTLYMNFGQRWSQSLTVTVAKRREKLFMEAGLAPKSLERRDIRVRGWIEERNGPRMEVSRPEQIEFADQE